MQTKKRKPQSDADKAKAQRLRNKTVAKQLADSKARFLKIYASKMGHLQNTCNAMCISRQTPLVWRHNDPVFAQAMLDVRESLIDEAEAQLHKNIREGKEASLIFYLKTQGKDRGYVERKEVTGLNGQPLTPSEPKTWVIHVKDGAGSPKAK